MQTRTICSVLITLVLTGNMAWSLQLRGPVMGYVLDTANHAIRPVNGIPGSSVLGQSLVLPFPVAALAVSPRGDFALTVSASGDLKAHMLRNLGNENNIDTIEGAISGADRVALNADASAAVLLASGARQLQVLRGLPSSLVVGPLFDLSSIDGTITALAIDGTGSNILIAVSAGHGALYLATNTDSRPRLIGNFGAPTALALLHEDQDVIVADAALNEITLVRNFAGTPEVFVLASERDGVAGPVGLRISADNHKLYIANGRSRTLDIWDFGTQSMEASHALDAEPTRLTAFQGSSTFLLNDVGDHPLLLLNEAIDPKIYFVPAGTN
jgi:hypothetical protein